MVGKVICWLLVQKMIWTIIHCCKFGMRSFHHWQAATLQIFKTGFSQYFQNWWIHVYHIERKNDVSIINNIWMHVPIINYTLKGVAIIAMLRLFTTLQMKNTSLRWIQPLQKIWTKAWESQREASSYITIVNWHQQKELEHKGGQR